MAAFRRPLALTCLTFSRMPVAASSLRSGRLGLPIYSPQCSPFRDLTPRWNSSSIASSPTPIQFQHPSRTRRFFSVLALGLIFTSTGFLLAIVPILPALNKLFMDVPSDAQTLDMFQPFDKTTAQIEDFLKNHPVSQAFRSHPDFREARPHLKIPEELRSHNLTGGALSGPGKIWVPPLSFIEEGGKSGAILYYLGQDLSGHPGVVHGGLLATLLDEGMARCCFGALPNKVGLTANLTVNYRKPMPVNSYVCLRATTTKVEGRKAWVEGRIESLVAEGETPVVYVEATALFIEPKQAATMARLYPAAAA